MTDRQAALETFLTAGDLDHAVAALDQLDPTDVSDPAVQAMVGARVGGVIDTWADRQPLANVLFHPDLIPGEMRVASVLRALRGYDDYLVLAAAVGVGQMASAGLSVADRNALVEALLDVIASTEGLVAARAAASLSSVVTPLHVPDLVVMLGHPDRAVRGNIVCALIPCLGATSMAELLADRDEISPADAEVATSALLTDGIDTHTPACDLRVLPVLDLVPNLASSAAGLV